MAEKILLKDLLFNKGKLALIAGQIKAVYPDFAAQKFCAEVNLQFQKLELKQRIVVIAIFLKKYLPADYKIALGILLDSLPEPLDENLSDDDFGDFIYASYGEFIVQNGCDKENLEISLRALKDLTKRFSVEYAIRDFLNNFSARSLEFLHNCSVDKNYHVRRLASEGTRPNLPWGKKIAISYKTSAEILENLYFDSSRFVTRSVANHLNDIAKIDPDFVLTTLKRWQKSKKQQQKEMDFIIKHALRTLIKQGNKAALELLGFHHKAKIILSDFAISKKVAFNENLEFSFALQSLENANAVVDYVIYFCNEKNILRAGKVFKLKNFTLEKDKIFVLNKKHKMLKQLTTRTLYEGECKMEIKVSGEVLQSANFLLMTD